MLQLQEQMGNSILFSFQDGKIYVGVKTQKDHFDIDIQKPLTEDVLYGYFQEVKIVFDIVEELNLNLDIWNKN